LSAVFEGRTEARLQRYELALAHAWHSAAFARAKRFPRRVPDIRTRRASPDNPQGRDDVLAIMRQLVAATNRNPPAE